MSVRMCTSGSRLTFAWSACVACLHVRTHASACAYLLDSLVGLCVWLYTAGNFDPSRYTCKRECQGRAITCESYLDFNIAENLF